ncbi:MAG: FmdB family zinc ribbon protein [Candidatus Margulisiibacteriota bacterium]
MPTYTYKCTDCDHQFETKHSMNADPLKKCPTCGKHALRRVIIAPAISFKGSGFYATDSRKKDSHTSCSTASKDNPSCASCPKAEKK